MPRAVFGLVGIGIFLAAVATGQAIPNLESMIINFASLGEGTQLLYQISSVVLGFAGSIYFMAKV